MKRYLLLLLPTLFAFNLHADTITIPRTQYTIVGYSSANPSNPVGHAIDGYQGTFWELYNPDNFPFPGFIEVDLGETLAVNGFNYRPKSGNSWERLSGYEVYLSMDGINWGEPEAMDNLVWTGDNDYAVKSVYFGAVDARYVRLVYTSSVNSPNNNIFTSELLFYRSTEPASGMSNQTISFQPIPKQYADAEPLELVATASSGLPVAFNVESGPATISGNMLTLTGEEGIVVVTASQEGNEDYYPIELTQSFEVVDLSLIYPEIRSSLTEDFPLQMASGMYAYPIYIHTSIDEAAMLTVDDVTIAVDGNTFPTGEGDGYRYFLWTPSDYGVHEVAITATASNGNDFTSTQSIDVVNTAANQNVTTLDHVVIEFGGVNSRWYEGVYTMPQHVGSYDQIMAFLDVTCPNGNCDDWDRLAYFEVQNPAGNWVQIIRYITPYGIGCNHSLDVTDYASLLQGSVRFRVFIDTWGTGGWELTLSFGHTAGTPEYPYSDVVEIWDGTYDFGNPANLQPVDTVSFAFPDEVETSYLRLSTTGHGWGSNNSQNAAEFFNATHYIDIDNSQAFVQHLWNTCNPNPDNCNGQFGTWQYNRAGWCPGSIAPPNVYLVGSPGGETKQFTYRFHPGYQDYCHPENPNCISGITCNDCNDGYNPHYVVDGQLINFGYTPMMDGVLGTKEIDRKRESYRVGVYPNPTTESFRIRADELDGHIRVTLVDIRGLAIHQYAFAGADEMRHHSFATSDLAPGVYFISVKDNRGTGVARVVVQ